MEVRLYECFKTIQGEGRLQGVPSILIRLGNCNLNCRWCDTQEVFQSQKGRLFSEEQLIKEIEKLQCNNIVITGGEPLIDPQIYDLVKLFKERGSHVTIETNATIIKRTDCDLISMSPKLKNSIPFKIKDKKLIEEHKNLRINIDAINYYIKNYDYQLKFVVRDNPKDIEEVNEILDQLDDYDPFKVMLMPLSFSRSDLYNIQENIVQLCIENGLRYANRLQLQLWENGEEVF